MAQLFNTYGEWYQGLTAPTEKSFAGGETPQAGGTQPQTAEAAPQATQAPQAPQTEPTVFKAPPPQGGSVFGGITSGAQSVAPDIAELGKSFREKAGPSRTFESIGGAAPLQQAIEKGEGTDVAKGMLAAQYKGPQTLEQAKTVNIQNMLKGFQGQAEGSRTLEGSMSLLQPLSQTATPGKLRQEALARMKDPTYRAEAQKAREAVQTSMGMLGREKTQAEQFAGQRTAEEEAIRKLAGEYVQGRKADVTGAMDTAVAAEAEKQARAQGLWDAFTGNKDRASLQQLAGLTGGLGAIQADPEAALQSRLDSILGSEQYAELAGIPELVANEGPGKKSKFAQDWYNTTGQKLGKQELKRLEGLARMRQKELDAARASAAQPDTLEQMFGAADVGERAKAQYASMLADPKYASIADVPPLELTVSKHGQRSYQRPKGLTEKQWKLAWQRQEELEKVFGSQTRSDKEDFTGELRNVMPLNFAGGPAAGIGERVYQAQDINQPGYLQFEKGLAPTRQSVGSVEQKQQFNRIEDLLGEAERLKETDPEQSTKLLADVDQYLADQEAELSARGVGIEEKQQEWVKQLRKARRAYRKTRTGLAGIGTVAGNTLGKWGVPEGLRGPLVAAGLASMTGGLGVPALPGGRFIPALMAEKATLGV